MEVYYLGEPTKQGKNDQPTDGEGLLLSDKKDQSTNIEIEDVVPLKNPDFSKN